MLTQWIHTTPGGKAWAWLRSHDEPVHASRSGRRLHHSGQARVLLQDALLDSLGIRHFDLTHTAHGQPLVSLPAGHHPAEERTAAPAVSLAHCDGFSACAVAPSGCRIGVDVETLAGRDWDGILALALHPAETARVHTLPAASRARQVLKLWCCKEALLKAWGTGIDDLTLLGRIGFSEAGQLVMAPPDLGDVASWHCESHFVGEQAAFATVWQ